VVPAARWSQRKRSSDKTAMVAAQAQLLQVNLLLYSFPSRTIPPLFFKAFCPEKHHA